MTVQSISILKKIQYFFEKSQNCIFYIFRGSKKMGPLKKKNVKFFSLCFRHQMNNCTKFAALSMKFSNITSPPIGPQAADPPLWKTHIFTIPKSCLFSKTVFIFYFLSLVGTPINDCAQNISILKKNYFWKNYKIAFFTFFEGLKKWAL